MSLSRVLVIKATAARPSTCSSKALVRVVLPVPIGPVININPFFFLHPVEHVHQGLLMHGAQVNEFWIRGEIEGLFV